jgi:hypothetical protein
MYCKKRTAQRGIFGRCLLCAVFFNYRRSPNFLATFSTVKVTKIGWATFWAFFSQTSPKAFSGLSVGVGIVQINLQYAFLMSSAILKSTLAWFV